MKYNKKTVALWDTLGRIVKVELCEVNFEQRGKGSERVGNANIWYMSLPNQVKKPEMGRVLGYKTRSSVTEVP